MIDFNSRSAENYEEKQQKSCS